MSPKQNRLHLETSPYLLSHATNPVDWYPWGEEALSRAKTKNRPILLSIGYSACHYCHLMEKESFENPAIARLMNDNFVCIKVDREDRPDLDETYMAPTQALTGSGGWPMTVALTPQQTPFFAGTYFPPKSDRGRPGFTELLERIAHLWKNNQAELVGQARSLTDAVEKSAAPSAPGGVSADAIRQAARSLTQNYDGSFGGFGGAPKFPNSPALLLLLRHYRRSGDEHALTMVTQTLDGMMTGGIYDQLGSGFCRYSVDRHWVVPHFEKMLHDTAQLVEVYLEAFQLTGDQQYRRVARDCLDFLIREMQSPAGGFFSSVDADSDGAEGRYYLWSKAELKKALGEPAATHFGAFYGGGETGQFGARSVLTTRRPLSEVAKEFGLSTHALGDSLESSRQQLLEARSLRVAPAVDDKILTAENGLCIRALALGARILGDGRYLTAAERAAAFILNQMVHPGGSLARSFRGERLGAQALLLDYAAFIDGLISLYEAGGTDDALAQAERLTAEMLEAFTDSAHPDGSLFHTSNQSEALIARLADARDTAQPGPNALACRVLFRLSVHTGKPAFRERAEGILRSQSQALSQGPRAFCTLLTVLDSLLEEPLTVVLSGDPSSEDYMALSEVIASRYLPTRVEASTPATGAEQPTPLTEGKTAIAGRATAWVCENNTCLEPTSDPDELEHLLSALEEKNLKGRRTLVPANGASGAPAHLINEAGQLVGRATKEATSKKSAPIAADAIAQVAGFSVSAVGLGTYRIGLQNPAHRAAVSAALQAGVQLIDTSPSFAFGESERLIGEVLRELILAGDLSRSEVVLISKLGVFVGGQTELIDDAPESETNVHKPPTLPLDRTSGLRAGAFSLVPENLEAQLSQSLERLGVEHLDICVIQSPEHLLLLGRTREDYRRALTEAFVFLESAVQAGRIGAYGVLTNTATLAPEEPGFVSIDELLECARTAAGAEHHLKLLELPVNLIETTAIRVSDGAKESLAERAKRLGLSVIAVRPLTALSEGGLLRLRDLDRPRDEDKAVPLSTARYKVLSLEAEFETTFAAQLRVAGAAGPGNILPLSGKLVTVLEQTVSLEQFELAETTMVTPRLRSVLAAVDQAFAGPSASNWEQFKKRYIHAVGTWLGAVRTLAVERSRERLEKLRVAQGLAQVVGEPEVPLVHAALTALIREPQIDALVVGLRSEAHVAEAKRLWTPAAQD